LKHSGFNKALFRRGIAHLSSLPAILSISSLSYDIAPPANHRIIVMIDSDLHWTPMLSGDSRRHHWLGCIVINLKYLRERSECVGYRLLRKLFVTLSHDCGNNFWHYIVILLYHASTIQRIYDLQIADMFSW